MTLETGSFLIPELTVNERYMSLLCVAPMRNISKLVATLLLLVTQVRTPILPILGDVAAAVKAPVAEAAGVYEVKLNTNSAVPLELVPATKQPDYEAEVLAPLHQAQAEAAAQAARLQAEAAARAKAAVQAAAQKAAVAVVIPTGDVWERLRLCEAGGNYARNSGNGYYGAYQYSLSTWGNYLGYARPDLAPPAVQDARAQQTQAARGWSPWPACSRALGLR
jgi:hypothetical protein